jgi:hypothetical protein
VERQGGSSGGANQMQRGGEAIWPRPAARVNGCVRSRGVPAKGATQELLGRRFTYALGARRAAVWAPSQRQVEAILRIQAGRRR